MNLNQIEVELRKSDFQYRLKAISALKAYPSDVAVPVLLQHTNDSEFLVRSFVARELGRHQTSESFAALLQIMRFDKVSAAYLIQTFFQDDHWLVRRSILPALVDLDCPEEVLEVCELGLAGEDRAVQEASVDALGALSGSWKQGLVLERLLVLSHCAPEHIRVRVAHALKHFDLPAAKAALVELRQDEDHRVVGAAMEGLLS
jgi:HEAT repeat protein